MKVDVNSQINIYNLYQNEDMGALISRIATVRQLVSVDLEIVSFILCTTFATS